MHTFLPPKLTKRQIQIIRLISEGFFNREIGKKLGIMQNTVEAHRANILRKLNIRNKAELVLYAVRKGIIKIEREVGDRVRR